MPDDVGGRDGGGGDGGGDGDNGGGDGEGVHGRGVNGLLSSQARSGHEARHQCSARKMKRLAHKASSLCSDDSEKYAATTARHLREKQRKDAKSDMSVPWNDDGHAGLRVAIHLGYDEFMTDRERTSLATQVCHAYAIALRRRAHEGFTTMRIALTGCASATQTLKHIDKDGGAQRWPVERLERHFAEALPALCGMATRVVVLSPDADEVLETVEADTVYVVGGLCDYSRCVKHTLESARASGVQARRLPLRETFDHRLSVEILTVEQAVAALHSAFSNGGNWGEALAESVPARKLKEVAVNKTVT
ncbi:tRNA (guanine(9)-N1)-methyltransferase [Pycnococcus provasolii]